jgi:hypothetical protein
VESKSVQPGLAAAVAGSVASTGGMSAGSARVAYAPSPHASEPSAATDLARSVYEVEARRPITAMRWLVTKASSCMRKVRAPPAPNSTTVVAGVDVVHDTQHESTLFGLSSIVSESVAAPASTAPSDVSAASAASAPASAASGVVVASASSASTAGVASSASSTDVASSPPSTVTAPPPPPLHAEASVNRRGHERSVLRLNISCRPPAALVRVDYALSA